LVGLGTGRASLHLRTATRSGPVLAPPGPGTAIVVPRGCWHRLVVDEPCDLVAVVVRPGTRHEPATDADPLGKRLGLRYDRTQQTLRPRLTLAGVLINLGRLVRKQF
jgi:hypothetical protein